MNRRFNKSHWVALACLWVGFSIVTFLITRTEIDRGPDHDKQVLLTTLGTIAGPLMGAIAREFQACCLRFSLQVMACSGPALLAGVLFQVIRLPDLRWVNWARMGLWIAGWSVWFLSGNVSFLHALS